MKKESSAVVLTNIQQRRPPNDKPPWKGWEMGWMGGGGGGGRGRVQQVLLDLNALDSDCTNYSDFFSCFFFFFFFFF